MPPRKYVNLEPQRQELEQRLEEGYQAMVGMFKAIDASHPSRLDNVSIPDEHVLAELSEYSALAAAEARAAISDCVTGLPSEAVIVPTK